MGNLYGPILTGVGLLEGGKLTKAAKDRALVEILALLVTGNENGKGGSPNTRIFNTLFPLPPVAGPVITNVTTLSKENAFWFGPDPFAAIIATQLNTPGKCPMWHTIFEDLLYEKLAVALDMNGTTPLFPAIFDITVAFPDIPFPITLPDLGLKLNLTPPQLLLKLGELGISLSLPPVSFTPPKFDLPNINLPVPPLVLGELCLRLFKLPFDLLLKFLIPSPELIVNLPTLPGLVLKFAFDIVIQILIDLGLLLIVPKLFIASLLIWLKNIVAMVCVDIVGMVVGAGGTVTKGVAVVTGLI